MNLFYPSFFFPTPMDFGKQLLLFHIQECIHFQRLLLSPSRRLQHQAIPLWLMTGSLGSPSFSFGQPCGQQTCYQPKQMRFRRDETPFG